MLRSSTHGTVACWILHGSYPAERGARVFAGWPREGHDYPFTGAGKRGRRTLNKPYPGTKKMKTREKESGAVCILDLTIDRFFDGRQRYGTVCDIHWNRQLYLWTISIVPNNQGSRVLRSVPESIRAHLRQQLGFVFFRLTKASVNININRNQLHTHVGWDNALIMYSAKPAQCYLSSVIN